VQKASAGRGDLEEALGYSWGVSTRFVRLFFERISRNNAQSSTLAAMRNVQLPKLVSGEIRVKDTKRFLKEHGL
jgi:type I restriction enzyme S subunit